MNLERTSTNTKIKQRKLFKKEIYEIKKTQDMKEEFKQRYGKPQKKRIKQKPWK
jgi:hypothetical protein